MNQTGKLFIQSSHIVMYKKAQLTDLLYMYPCKCCFCHTLQLASRQGLRRTLISATRKWLGGGRQLNHMSPGTHNAISSSSGSVVNRRQVY